MNAQSKLGGSYGVEGVTLAVCLMTTSLRSVSNIQIVKGLVKSLNSGPSLSIMSTWARTKGHRDLIIDLVLRIHLTLFCLEYLIPLICLYSFISFLDFAVRLSFPSCPIPGSVTRSYFTSLIFF
jgi:hypothetical protein